MFNGCIRDGLHAGKALCVLPHDGASERQGSHDVSFESAFRDAGFQVTVIPNQGKGAAKMRLSAAGGSFPRIWFNEDRTEAGRDALGWYHEKKSDDDREIGLGPEHDWSSHGADAFGLMCVAYEEPKKNQEKLTLQPFGAV
jgi:phage terminase large subunit